MSAFREGAGGLAVVVAVLWTVAATAHGPGHSHADEHHGANESRLRPAEARVIDALEARMAGGEDANPGVVSRLAALRLDVALRTRDHDDYAIAARAFDAWRALPGAGPAAWDGTTRVRLGLHHFEAALESARRSLALASDRAGAWLLLGDVHDALGHWAEAEAAYVRAEALRGPDLESRSRLAGLHALRGDVARADRAWAEAIAAGEAMGAGDETVAWCLVRWAELAESTGDLQVAAERLDRALRLAPGSVDGRMTQARVRLARGEAAAARDGLLVLERERPDPLVWIQLADALDRTGDPTGARRLRDRARRALATEVAHDEIGHLRALGELMLSLGEPKDALALFRRDLELRRDARTLELVAISLHRLGRACEAAGPLREALEQGIRAPGLLETARSIERAGAEAGCDKAVSS